MENLGVVAGGEEVAQAERALLSLAALLCVGPNPFSPAAWIFALRGMALCLGGLAGHPEAHQELFKGLAAGLAPALAPGCPDQGPNKQ